METFDVMFEPSVDFAVTADEPTAWPVTTPTGLTVATVGLLESQFRLWLVALAGETVGVNVTVPPLAFTDVDPGLMVIPVTSTDEPPPVVVMTSWGLLLADSRAFKPVHPPSVLAIAMEAILSPDSLPCTYEVRLTSW